MRGVVVVKSGEKPFGSFYVVGESVARFLRVPVVELEPPVYLSIAKMRPDFVVSVGTLSTGILATKLAALASFSRRVFAYVAVEGYLNIPHIVSKLTNLVSSSGKVSLVAPSSYVKEELLASGLKTSCIIPHGLDLGEIDRIRGREDGVLHETDEIRVLAILSSLSQLRKSLGLRFLLKSWSNIPTGARKKARLVLKVPRGQGVTVRPMAKAVGLGEGEFTVLDEFLSREELLRLYLSSHLYVHATLADAFGLPIIEALSCGTPVVVLGAKPWTEVVSDEVAWIAKVARESFVSEGNRIYRLKIPDLQDMSKRLEEAIEFCSGDQGQLRKRCIDYAQRFDANRTYRKFRELISDA